MTDEFRQGIEHGLEMAWEIVNKKILDITDWGARVGQVAITGSLEVARNDIRRAFDAARKKRLELGANGQRGVEKIQFNSR